MTEAKDDKPTNAKAKDVESIKAAKRWMTLRDLCEAASVSHEAVARWVRDEVDPLPAMRFGRRWLFDAATVERWMTRRASRSLGRKQVARA